MIKALLRGIFKIAGIAAMGYAAFLIIHWYIYWLQYYFIGNIKISILVGLVTFFMSPIAAIADLFWHSMPANTVAMGKFFIIYFVAGRILFWIGEIFDESK